MPKIQEKPPKKLQPFIFHGVDLDWQSGETEAKADECPWCGHDEFSVNRDTTLWQCFSCGEKGNSSVFLQHLWDISDAGTTDYSVLSETRGLIYPETLMHWGVVFSPLTRRWLVPGYDADGKLRQLYKWVEMKDRSLLLPTPTLGHHLHGVNLYDESKSVVHLCEGPWDGMVLWEFLRHTKETDKGLRPTANPDASLLSGANVLAVPGCQVFDDSWMPLFAGKTVNLMYDNDHPKRHPKTGKTTPPAGPTAMRRIGKLLLGAKDSPSEVNYLRWGKDGFDPELPSGFDVKDCLDASH